MWEDFQKYSTLYFQMKVVCFAKQKEKDSKFFCYPFIIPKKSLREERIIDALFVCGCYKGQEPNLLNSGTPRDTMYSWGKGANKQKTNKQINCVCLVESAVCAVAFGGCLQTLAFFRATHFCHCKALPIMGPQKILCTFGKKAHTALFIDVDK